MGDRVRIIVESRWFQSLIASIIIINAVVIAWSTFDVDSNVRFVLDTVDSICIAVYVVEMAMRIYVKRAQFFRNGWDVFDFVIVCLSVLPSFIIAAPVEVIRILRLFKTLGTLRLISAFRPLRVMMDTIESSLSGIAWSALLLISLSFIYAVIGVTLFSNEFPEHFGDFFTSMFTLFTFATIEGWPDIARTIMATYPWAWIYFVSFVLLGGFVIMDVIVGFIVNAVDESEASMRAEEAKQEGSSSIEQLQAEIANLKSQLEMVEAIAENVAKEEKKREKKR